MSARATDTRRLLRMATTVSATFDTYRRRRGAEAGGILLGRVYPSETVIEAVTTPTAADKAGRFFFDRSHTKAGRRECGLGENVRRADLSRRVALASHGNSRSFATRPR